METGSGKTKEGSVEDLRMGRCAMLSTPVTMFVYDKTGQNMYA
jgi:hypothetical protein